MNFDTHLPYIAGGFGTILADPPWLYNDQGSRISPRRGEKDPATRYRVMDLQAIREMPIGALAADRAYLFLWVTHSFCEQAYGVARAWGFRPVSQIVWVKMRDPREIARDLIEGHDEIAEHLGERRRDEIDVHAILEMLDGMRPALKRVGKPQIGMGHHVRCAHELVIIGERGGQTGLARNVPSIIFGERAEHSRKPDSIYPVCEALGPGPRLELFARRRRPGWHSYGDQLPEKEDGNGRDRLRQGAGESGEAASREDAAAAARAGGDRAATEASGGPLARGAGIER